MQSKLGALVVLLALSSVVMMLGYQKYAPQQIAQRTETPAPAVRVEPQTALEKPERARPKAVPNAQPGAKPEAGATLTLYVPRAGKEDLFLAPVQRKSEQATPLAALKALAAFDGESAGERPLPKGTKVLGLAVAPDGVATADFSQEIIDNFPGGSRTEQVMLGSIVNTLTGFPNIKKVAVTVDGKPVDSIGGHVELSEPLERDTGLIQGE